MKAEAFAMGVALLLFGACTGSGPGGLRSETPADDRGFEVERVAGPNPWTHLDFQDAPEDFTFAVISDLTGGYREGIFPEAVEKLNLLQPEFIVSVGDLIEGIGLDHAGVRAEWDRFEEMLAPLSAPFFFVPGNHDYGSGPMNDVWAERLGRSYYSFVYREVLFLALNTEIETGRLDRAMKARIAEYTRMKAIDPERARALGRQIVEDVDYNGSMPGGFGPEQMAFIERTIAEHPDVRWTLLFMHQPLWQGEASPQLEAIERALGDRDYTVFAGHVHNYRYTERHGHDFIRLSTTGGSWSPIPGSPNNFDHVTLITMREDGPVVANLRLDGIVDKFGYPEADPSDTSEAVRASEH